MTENGLAPNVIDINAYVRRMRKSELDKAQKEEQQQHNNLKYLGVRVCKLH